MESKLHELKLEDKTDINILLLGETGVGKSTFINSIANYLHHQDLEKALKEPPFTLIPCMFTITDEFYQIHKVTIGSDANECLEVGDSATQDVKTYVFPIGNGKTRIRLIDTPGMGDPRGVDQDDVNCENILAYIGQLHELHAICFLFKPNDARITVTFEYCVKQILSRLEKSAAKNIIFLFTNTKGTNYKPGETIACLSKVVEEIKKQPPNVDIKVKENIFCFDNEAFRFLAASKKGVEFSSGAKKDFLRSWKTSTEEAWKMIRYIVGDSSRPALAPHYVKASTSINEARRVINQLGQPMADISQLIFDNIRILDRRERELLDSNLSLDQMRTKLYVPIVNLKVIKLTQPATVCCDEKCAEIVPIDGVSTWNYKQRCHDPCHLKNVPHEIIGAPQLQDCAAMNRATQTCIQCGCSQTVHMHIYYMTKKFDDKKVDRDIEKRINTNEKALAEAERVIGEIKKRKMELEVEKDVIVSCAAKFARFLQKNAITPVNDAYKKYIEYMIAREEGLGSNADRRLIVHYKKLLDKYQQITSTFDLLFSTGAEDTTFDVHAKSINQQLDILYALKHNGAKIKELYMSQKTSRRKEYEQSEYIHASPVQNPRDPREIQSDVEGEKKKQFQNKTFNKKDFKNQKPFQQKFQNKKNNNQQHHNPRAHSAHRAPGNYTTTTNIVKTGDNEEIKIEITKTKATLANHNRNSQGFNCDNKNPKYHDKKRADDNRNQKYGLQNHNHRSSHQASVPSRSPHEQRPPSNYPQPDYRPSDHSHRDYRPPAADYRPPPADYRPPPADYRPAPADYRPPPADYRPPPADYRPPPADYRSPSSDYRPPPADYRPPPADYRPPPADYRPPPADFRPPPADYRPPPADYRPPASDYRPPPADYRPPPDYRPSSDRRPQDHRSSGEYPPSDYRPPYERPPHDYRAPSEPPSHDYRPPSDYSPNDNRYPSDRPAHDYRPPSDRQPLERRSSDYAQQDYRPYDHSDYHTRPYYGPNDNRPPIDSHGNRPYQTYGSRDYRPGEAYGRVPPPPYSLAPMEDEEKNKNKQTKPKRGRSRPNYRSSGEKGFSSCDTD